MFKALYKKKKKSVLVREKTLLIFQYNVASSLALYELFKFNLKVVGRASVPEDTSGMLSSQSSLDLVLDSMTLELGFRSRYASATERQRAVHEVVNGMEMRGGQRQQLLTQWPGMEHLHKSEHL